MLERRLFRRKSTGEVIDPTWLRFSFPHLVPLRRPARRSTTCATPASRRTTASPRRSRSSRRQRDPDGRWPLQNVHEGESHFEMEDGEGTPSRWNTLSAMRVLDWYAQGG